MFLNGGRGFLYCLALAAACARGEDGVTLKAGDPAPKLFASKWLNGDEVKSFEKGKVYVLECWATWCGPCRAAIPHVSELNTKYKDKGVVFIGMNVWERNVAGVEPFVKQMGEKMNYRVALDEPGEKQGKTAAAWLSSSGQRGIPCTFIVDKEGKLAWIGHPMSMERIVEQVAAGTFDVKKQAEFEAKRQALEDKLEEAANANAYDKMLKLADEITALDPASATQMCMMRFSILLQQKKYDDGYALAGKLAENEMKNDSEGLNAIAWSILDMQGLEKRDYDVALKLAQQADTLTKHANPAILDTLARAYFEKGQPAKALELETLAMEKADDAMKKQLAETLAKYKEAAEKKK